MLRKKGVLEEAGDVQVELVVHLLGVHRSIELGEILIARDQHAVKGLQISTLIFKDKVC